MPERSEGLARFVRETSEASSTNRDKGVSQVEAVVRFMLVYTLIMFIDPVLG